MRSRLVGEGSFGKVWKEIQNDPGDAQEVRAVKVIEKERMKRFRIDFKKELLALTKLTKEEVILSVVSWTGSGIR